MGKSSGPWKSAALTGLIGIDLAAATFGGFWLGRWIDRATGLQPVFLIVGVLVGLGVGIYSISRLIKSFFGDG
jgi:ATP synthase protein I